MAEKKRRPWKLYFGALLLFAVLIGGCVGPRFIVYSEGHRVGTIEKLSTKGLFMKTTEGELAMRGFGGSQSGKEGQSSGNTWSFTVVDKSIVEEINAIPPGQVVKLHYEEYFFKPIIGHTKYRATRVERVDRLGQPRHSSSNGPVRPQ